MNAKLLALNLFPNPTLLGVPISGMLTTPQTNDISRIRKQLVEYILSIGQELSLKFSTVSSAFDLMLKYLSVGSQTINKQLLAMTCLFISSKLHEVQGISLTLIHKLSDHSYTSKEILLLQAQVLSTLNFNILAGSNLNAYVQILFSVISQLIPSVRENTHKEFLETTVRIQKLLMKNPPLAQSKALGPAIIVAALVIMSRCEGRFPVLCRLSALSCTPQQQILQLSQKVLKSVLGKDLYRSLRAQ